MIPLGVLAGRRSSGSDPAERWVGLSDNPPPGASAILLVMANGVSPHPSEAVLGSTSMDLVADAPVVSGGVTNPYLSVWYASEPDGDTLATSLPGWTQVLWVDGLEVGGFRIGRNVNNELPQSFAPDPLPHSLPVGPSDLVLSIRTGRGIGLIAPPDFDYFDTNADPLPSGATTRSSRWTVGTAMPGDGWGFYRYSIEANLVLTPA